LKYIVNPDGCAATNFWNDDFSQRLSLMSVQPNLRATTGLSNRSIILRLFQCNAFPW